MLGIFSLMLLKSHLMTDQNITMNPSKISNKWFNKECVKSRRNYGKAKCHYYTPRSVKNKKVLSDA